MARSYANVATAIWRDDEFRALSIDAQHTYLLLVSQPDISAAGVLSLNLTRWSSRAKNGSRTALRDAIEELQDHRFVVVDDDTEELLVRSFVRWDGGYSNSKRRFSIRDAAVQIESTALRRALAAEFQRLELPTEWIPTFQQVDSPSVAHTESGDGVSGSRRVVVTEVSTNGPQPSTHTPHSSDRTPPPSFAQGGRADARDERPPEACPNHIDDPDPPSCGRCAGARRARARWDLADADRRRNAPKCRKHRGQPADNCALCRSEDLANGDVP